jgi:hypothetical protein
MSSYSTPDNRVLKAGAPKRAIRRSISIASLAAVIAFGFLNSKASATAICGGTTCPTPTVAETSATAQFVGGEVDQHSGSAAVSASVDNLLSSANASVSGDPVRQVHADASQGNPLSDPAIAIASLEYSFVVAGPVLTTVPVIIAGSLTTSANTSNPGSASAVAEILLNDLTSGREVYSAISCYNSITFGCLTTSQLYSSLMRIPVGDLIDVTLDAPALAQEIVPAITAKSDATADPSIYIDPTFPDASEYSIILSDGVANPPPEGKTPVPEPGSLLLLSAATCLLGLWRRGSVGWAWVRHLAVQGRGRVAIRNSAAGDYGVFGSIRKARIDIDTERQLLLPH